MLQSHRKISYLNFILWTIDGSRGHIKWAFSWVCDVMYYGWWVFWSSSASVWELLCSHKDNINVNKWKILIMCSGIFRLVPFTDLSILRSKLFNVNCLWNNVSIKSSVLWCWHQFSIWPLTWILFFVTSLVIVKFLCICSVLFFAMWRWIIRNTMWYGSKFNSNSFIIGDIPFKEGTK